jgi:hypothetical protein
MVTTGRAWTLMYSGSRPWKTNRERTLSPFARARLVTEWRQAFAVLARQQQIPELDIICVRCWPLAVNRRALQDVSNHYWGLQEHRSAKHGTAVEIAPYLLPSPR